jgi:hypothetical protein
MTLQLDMTSRSLGDGHLFHGWLGGRVLEKSGCHAAPQLGTSWISYGKRSRRMYGEIHFSESLFRPKIDHSSLWWWTERPSCVRDERRDNNNSLRACCRRTDEGPRKARASKRGRANITASKPPFSSCLCCRLDESESIVALKQSAKFLLIPQTGRPPSTTESCDQSIHFRDLCPLFVLL